MITIRDLSSLRDYAECVALQDETWGSGFSERVPTAILRVSQLIGGVAAGAFDEGDQLVGFVFGLTLEGGDPREMFESLTRRLRRLEDRTVLLPGHNYAERPTSTLGDERRSNPYLQFHDLQSFLDKRMRR